jgi:hypothetical protein
MPKTEVVDANGCHLRYVHAELAKAMVDAGTAAIASANVRVKGLSTLAEVRDLLGSSL